MAAKAKAIEIRYPRPLLDKLGVKAGARVALVGLREAELPESPRSRTDDLSLGRAKAGSDLVLAGFESRDEIGGLAALRGRIKPDGAIWAIWPKGRKELREDDFRAAGPGLGLVDVKVVSVSERLSGLKLVIPVAQRPKPEKRPRAERKRRR
ncbi:MAG: DUF3052 domain-containing protein [Vicinamibacteria bacterium]